MSEPDYTLFIKIVNTLWTNLFKNDKIKDKDMKFFVKVKVGAREEKIEKLDEVNFKVSVKQLPEKGKANKAVIKVMADYFKVGRDDIQIISGSTSRLKIIKINNYDQIK